MWHTNTGYSFVTLYFYTPYTFDGCRLLYSAVWFHRRHCFGDWQTAYRFTSLRCAGIRFCSTSVRFNSQFVQICNLHICTTSHLSCLMNPAECLWVYCWIHQATGEVPEVCWTNSQLYEKHLDFCFALWCVTLLEIAIKTWGNHDNKGSLLHI